jgi:hypothetical protein
MMDDTKEIVLFLFQQIRNLKVRQRRSILYREMKMVVAFENLLKKGEKLGEFEVRDARIVANNIMVLGQMWVFRSWALRHNISIQDYIEQQTTLILKSISPQR